MSLLGVLKGTELAKQIDQSMEAELRGVGMYYALALLAREQGHPETAKTLESIANDEARHAGLYSVLNGHVQADIFATLAQFAQLESNAETRIAAFAEAVRKLGQEDAALEIEATAKDEGRHGVLLQALVEKHGNPKKRH